MNKSIIHDAIVLCLITLIAGVALGGVHELTAEPIAIAHEKAANETYREVFPDAVNFRTDEEIAAKLEAAAGDIAAQGFGTVEEVKTALDASDNVIGYIVNATGKGYGGPVQISCGISSEGKLTGLGFLSISETPGLGMRANTPEFRSQFPGKSAAEKLELVKSGEAGEHGVQAISGASITSGAVTNALNAAVYFVNQIM